MLSTRARAAGCVHRRRRSFESGEAPSRRLGHRSYYSGKIVGYLAVGSTSDGRSWRNFQAEGSDSLQRSPSVSHICISTPCPLFFFPFCPFVSHSESHLAAAGDPHRQRKLQRGRATVTRFLRRPFDQILVGGVERGWFAGEGIGEDDTAPVPIQVPTPDPERSRRQVCHCPADLSLRGRKVSHVAHASIRAAAATRAWTSIATRWNSTMCGIISRLILSILLPNLNTHFGLLS